MIELLVKGVLAYLLGSLVGSLLIARFTGGADIRTMGSGNAGATNALRTQGKKIAFFVFVIDLAKGWVATAVLAPAAVPGMESAATEFSAWSVPVCGIAVMLGHVYPVFFGFRGGKGMATLVGAVLGISGWLLLAMILVFVVALILFGFVGLASILGAATLVAVLLARGASPPLLSFAVLATLLVLYTHRGNLARMKAGTEPRAKRVWLLGTRRTAA
jgi:acyl phosphate:glycerol-3-phosphate acyltransferase